MNEHMKIGGPHPTSKPIGVLKSRIPLTLKIPRRGVRGTLCASLRVSASTDFFPSLSVFFLSAPRLTLFHIIYICIHHVATATLVQVLKSCTWKLWYIRNHVVEFSTRTPESNKSSVRVQCSLPFECFVSSSTSIVNSVH